MGGVTAMAMASALETQGAEVDFVGLLDVTHPASIAARARLASIATEENSVLNYLRSFSRLQRVVERKDSEADLNAVLTPAAIERLAEASARLTEKERFIYAALWGQSQGLWDNVSEELMESLYAEQLNSETILAKFALPRVRAPLHVWWTETTLQAHGGAPVEWDDHTEGAVITTIVSGDHESVIEDPAVHDSIATALKNLPKAAKLQSPKSAV
jgi:thioesterase domain-containing protein